HGNEIDFVNISMSLYDKNLPTERDEELPSYLTHKLLDLKKKGIGVIIAAGNDGEFFGDTRLTESLANLANQMEGSLVFVGATNINSSGEERICAFSNKAGMARHFIFAPGENIETVFDISYGNRVDEKVFNGTSSAAPFITGVFAVIKEAYPQFSAQEIANIVCKTARRISANSTIFFDTKTYGNGIVDMTQALKYADTIAKDA